jgi:hypothetical protein
MRRLLGGLVLAAFSNGDRSSLEEGSGELLLQRGRLFEPRLYLHAAAEVQAAI